MRVTDSPPVVPSAFPLPSVRRLARGDDRRDAAASSSMPHLTPEPMNLSSAQDDPLPDDVSVQTDDIDLTVFDQDWSCAASASGSGTEVGGPEFVSDSVSPSLGASHEGRPPVLTRSDLSDSATASGAGTEVSGHEFVSDSVSPSLGASHVGSNSGSGTGVGGHEFVSDSVSPSLGARHEGSVCRQTRSSASGTGVDGHEFVSDSVSSTSGVSHEGGLASPVCALTESGTSTEFIESTESGSPGSLPA